MSKWIPLDGSWEPCPVHAAAGVQVAWTDQPVRTWRRFG
jgi:hypothetical protein